METLEKMRSLTEAKNLTAEDKEMIKAQCLELGIAFAPSGRCSQCYNDAAIQCVIAMTTESRANRLKAGVDVLVNGQRLNEATLTDEWYERLKVMPEDWRKQYLNED